MGSIALRIKAAPLFFHFPLCCFLRAKQNYGVDRFSHFLLQCTTPLHLLAKNSQCTCPQALWRQQQEFTFASFVFEQERRRTCRELKDCFLPLQWKIKYLKIWEHQKTNYKRLVFNACFRSCSKRGFNEQIRPDYLKVLYRPASSFAGAKTNVCKCKCTQCSAVLCARNKKGSAFICRLF